MRIYGILCTIIICLLLGYISVLLNFKNKYEVTNQPVRADYKLMDAYAKKQVDCLAQNMFFEAGYEPMVGQVAVALVTQNRVESPNFPNTICEVVKQKGINSKGRTVCQFSWYCERKPHRQLRNRKVHKDTHDVYARIHEMATQLYANLPRMNDYTEGATYYHADYVAPAWRKTKEVSLKVGRHIFYVAQEDI